MLPASLFIREGVMGWGWVGGGDFETVNFLETKDFDIYIIIPVFVCGSEHEPFIV